jgi:hypothetical protein
MTTSVNRYSKDPSGNVLVDVSAGRAEDLYNVFDRSSPYSRRDLDEDLVDYIIECARELGDEPFAIRVSLASPPDDSMLGRIKGGIRNYFVYRAGVEERAHAHLIHRSLLFFALGVTILLVSIWLRQWLGDEPSALASVLSEGLTVAAWVSLWESLAGFLIEWLPKRKNLALYRRLASTEVVFSSAGHDLAAAVEDANI